jgi:hypothetical protein
MVQICLKSQFKLAQNPQFCGAPTHQWKTLTGSPFRRLPGGLEEFLLLLGPRAPVPARPRPLVQDTEEEEDTMDTHTMAR